MTMRYVDTSVDRPRWRFNAAYRVKPNLSLGLEYNPVVAEVNPTANWIIQNGSESKPMVSFGTSSDRIFTPKGNQAYYVSFAKLLPGMKIAPYFSINYSEYESGFNFPFGVNWGMTEAIDLLAMNDGRKSHVLLTYKWVSANVSFMVINLQKPKFGISLGWGF